MPPLFPHGGDCREEQTAARKLGRRLLNAVQAALIAAYPTAGSALRLEVRVSRRREMGCCLILHRLYANTRREKAHGGWLPWSWPLTAFTEEDAVLLSGGQLPAIVRPCVIDWTQRLRTPSPNPRVTV